MPGCNLILCSYFDMLALFDYQINVSYKSNAYFFQIIWAFCLFVKLSQPSTPDSTNHGTTTYCSIDFNFCQLSRLSDHQIVSSTAGNEPIASTNQLLPQLVLGVPWRIHFILVGNSDFFAL
ncbi:hypothetical protein NPIL_245691 [Nephila pilipes]|uniref:Uncharacterized protein n=1 Tax=Nephila pilipes TaxID=299642 RepID=A0A8X6PGV7_NEPPI|nr:hypothetical protein NPIL_245691 [Nephila pilipes]